MKRGSLGLIETWGFTPAVVAADTGMKAANVRLISCRLTRPARITITFGGDVAAVGTAVKAAATAAANVGRVISTHVIARPDISVLKLFEKEGKTGPKPKEVNLATKKGGLDESPKTPLADETSPPANKTDVKSEQNKGDDSLKQAKSGTDKAASESSEAKDPGKTAEEKEPIKKSPDRKSEKKISAESKDRSDLSSIQGADKNLPSEAETDDANDQELEEKTDKPIEKQSEKEDPTPEATGAVKKKTPKRKKKSTGKKESPGAKKK